MSDKNDEAMYWRGEQTAAMAREERAYDAHRKADTVAKLKALCDDNERLAGERDQARRDAVALWNPHARFENPLELRDRIVAYRAALRDTDK